MAEIKNEVVEVVEDAKTEVVEEKKGIKKVLTTIPKVAKKAWPYVVGGVVAVAGVGTAYFKMKGHGDGYSELPGPVDFAPTASSEDFAEVE